MKSPLHKTMGWRGPLTYRQLETWNAWLAEDLNHPGKTESYLMQCAAETRRSNAKNPDNIDLNDFKLKFSTVSAPPTLSQEEMLRREKAAAIAMVGGKVEHRVITREELEEQQKAQQ